MGVLFDDSVLVVLATAPAGLGHIRVTEALRQGLSEKTRVVYMGVADPGLQWLHRLTSLNGTLKRLMEFTQENRTVERLFSEHYRHWLQKSPDGAAKELTNLITHTQPTPQRVLVVATHFGLAHQLAAIKPELEQTLGVKLVLAVVVTDDSPQKMWAVTGAEVIFVPSNTTREVLLGHLMANSGPVPEVVTIPYPVSVTLGEPLSEEEYAERLGQMRQGKLKLVIPISGAAVQLAYFKDVIGAAAADGVEVTVVSRNSRYTQDFLQWCRSMAGVEVVAYAKDSDIVKAYDREYMLSVIGAEITKPSEQAFKALLTPRQRGGSVLLFSPPVGRQEKDNLAFLRRHRLMPSVDDQARLNEWIFRGNRLIITPELMARAHHWRAILLPETGLWAAVAVKRLKEGGILAQMAAFTGFVEGHEEINSDGVKAVWHYLKQELSQQVPA